MQVYLVGGAIRDRLLGVTPRERDWVVVGAQPQDVPFPDDLGPADLRS